MKTIEELIQQLRLFSRELINLQPPADEVEILKFEEKFGFQLPKDYKTFLKVHNGLSLMGVTIYGVDSGSLSFSLEKSYLFEHDEVDHPMPEYFIPFSPDGSGNHYCFDLRTCNLESCEIVFWQHDFIYNDEDKPEVVYSNFADWVEEVVINWTLEDYDYNGNSK